MTDKHIDRLITVGASLIGGLLVSWFILSDPAADFTVAVPGMDDRPAHLPSDTERVDIGSLYASFDGVPSGITGSWPRFRGSDFDNISDEDIPLADGIGPEGPAVLWSVDLGEGHAGPVVADGRVYLLDYDEEERADILRCFSLDDGAEIWRRGYGVQIKRNHGMSRTVPAVTDSHVVTIGPKCHVMSVDAETGDFAWGIDLVREYGAEVPLWYTGQCPLVDGSLAIIAVGGEALLIAVDVKTGEVVWKTPNPRGWKMSHSSVLPYTVHGRKMYVYCALGGIVGVAAEGPDAGAVLFETDAWNKNVVAPSPLYLGDGRLFMTAGYGSGSMMFEIGAMNGNYTITPAQQVEPGGGMASEQQTPLFFDDHLFCIMPKDAGALKNQFVCYSPDDITEPVWSSGPDHRYGLGPYLIADGKFFILSDEGVLTVMKVSTAQPDIIGEWRILDGHDAWGPMALVEGRLLARDSRRLVCVDIRSAGDR